MEMGPEPPMGGVGAEIRLLLYEETFRGDELTYYFQLLYFLIYALPVLVPFCCNAWALVVLMLWNIWIAACNCHQEAFASNSCANCQYTLTQYFSVTTN